MSRSAVPGRPMRMVMSHVMMPYRHKRRVGHVGNRENAEAETQCNYR